MLVVKTIATIRRMHFVQGRRYVVRGLLVTSVKLV
jgi:hypothetical protein